jgi:hypothetical protein
MTRSVRTLPFAFVSGGDPEFSLTNKQWKKIERAYGHPLTDDVKQAIVGVTIKYLLFEPFERSADPVSLERKRVVTVRKATKTLYDALATATAPTATVYEVVRLLPSLAGECACQLATLDDPSLPGHREGECWRDWVLALEGIAEQNKLPFRVRNDTDKDRGEPSAFVVLVHELQLCMKPEARRYMHSKVGLAKAINRACGGKA